MRGFCCCCAFLFSLLCAAATWEDCPTNGCPDVSGLNLTFLQGSWEAVYFSSAEGSMQARIPTFFNVSLCGPLPSESQCSESSVCYSERLESFLSLGTRSSCRYNYEDRQLQFIFDYHEQATRDFGPGNVTVTLICGKNLGVPEVIVGDPHTHAVEILWITSAACKTDTGVAPTNESKCYLLQPYEDPASGLQAKFIDLSNLIRARGHNTTYAEMEKAEFRVSVCRPLQGSDVPEQCVGAMMCLTQTDPNLHVTTVAPLAYQNGEQSNLHIEDDLPTIVYTMEQSECEDTNKRVVKIHFMCPSGNEALGPSITFLNDKLCLIIVNWYTSYACGSTAIQSAGCQLTTANGVFFDLSGLGNAVMETNATAGGTSYQYQLQICNGTAINPICGRNSASQTPIRVAQIDPEHGGVCKALGVGDGKLRFADGSLTLTYSLGDKCHSNFARTSVINFVCPKNLGTTTTTAEVQTNQVRYLTEENCFYEFEWITPLACGSTTSGASDCNFKLEDSTYNFAPLVGSDDKNWVAVDDDPDTACFMINPCGALSVTNHSQSATDYCNNRLAPMQCAGSSVCQILNDGTALPTGTFNLQNASSFTSIDKNVLTILGGGGGGGRTAVVHYVCKPGDLTTPPVFINETNTNFFEFHWTTFAACPLGVQVGQDCTVTNEATGFTFNLSSLSAVQYNFSDSDYTYEVAVCSELKSTACTHEHSALCQTKKSDSRAASMGVNNSTLIYADGTLKLHYQNGSACSTWPHRNSTILFECDSMAHTPTIGSIEEADHCQYVVEMQTKLACPPAYRVRECVHFDKNGTTYDFSGLSKTAGNWETRGPDGSVYYINVCQALNRIGGCSPLSAVCRVRQTDASVKYTTLGLASSANFTVVHQTNKHSVVLSYSFTRADPPSGECEVETTSIELVCNSTASGESGPKFESGGDEANPCHYSFVWQTPAACRLQDVTVVQQSCNVTDPETGYVFDFSPLHTATQDHFTLTTEEESGHSFNLTVCKKLNHSCHSLDSAVVCQHTAQGKNFKCGDLGSQTVRFFDGSITISYSGGEVCEHNKKPRSVLVNLECDRSVYIGQPRYVQESDCEYSFEWPTALACPPRELECVAEGGKYDLRPLFDGRNWVVNTESSDDDYRYIIGGCKSLNFESSPQCPQKPGMGACRYPTKRVGGAGDALGFVTADLVVEDPGVLRLTYYNGDKWCGNGRSGVVNVNFRCNQERGVGVPEITNINNDLCEVDIDWSTQYACPLDATSNNTWAITNPVTNQTYNLTTLPKFLEQNYTELDGTTYTYSIGLNGYALKPAQCPGHEDAADIGGCQHRVGADHGKSLGKINATLNFIGGELRAEYRDGDVCHHTHTGRKSVITFECDSQNLLEVLPEEDCEYSFIVHTNLACARNEHIGVHCQVSGFDDLASFLSLKTPAIPLGESSQGAKAYMSVCEPIGSDNQADAAALTCPTGSAACIINGSTTLDLGHPSPRYPPKLLNAGNGIILNYTQGSCCNPGCTNRYQTDLILICNRNVPVGVPTFISQSNCKYIFRWESIHACPQEVPSTNVSRDVCTITDPSSGIPYNFTDIALQEVTVPGFDTTYYIQLCGNATTPPQGCSQLDNGVCKKSGGSSQTLVKAEHKFAITSHSPHVIEVVYTSGIPCGSLSDGKFWTAFVTMQCKSRGGTPAPMFVSDDDCELQFLWQNSSFCVGEEECSVTDPDTNYVYDLDGLFSQTWSGVASSGGSYTMSVCRNLNPFASSGKHCSSPSGVCLTTSDGRNINLGHMTKPPAVEKKDSDVAIVLNYVDGDLCATVGAKKYLHSTRVTLVCGTSQEQSAPVLQSVENCSYSLTWETPLACQLENKTSSSCTYNDPHTGSEYNFKPLSHSIDFSHDREQYGVCLCPSNQCRHAQIWHTVEGKNVSLGAFQKMVVTGTTSGPQILFTKPGDPCKEVMSSGHMNYKSTVFMECDRNADRNKGSIALQESLSDGCHKYFFWFTPYACLSEQISCALNLGSVRYDLAPLHSEDTPWRVKVGNSEYLISICGPIDNTGTACSPESSVCVKRGDGKYEDLASANTQEIVATSDGNVRFKFSGPQECQGRHNSHVTIDMICGIGGLKFAANTSCDYTFEWHTPYACKESNQLTTVTDCRDQLKGGDNFVFYPKNLKNKNGYTVEDNKGDRFYINFCNTMDDCGDQSSVCMKHDEATTAIGSYTNQKITVQGFTMEVQMSTSNNDTHAIIRVECVSEKYPSETDLEKVLFETAVTHHNHKYYYFRMRTQKGCNFKAPPTQAPPTSSSGGGDGGNKTPAKTSGGKSSTVIAIILVVVIFVIVAILIGLIVYKKERREYILSFFGKKAVEPVRYIKLSTQERGEAAALLEDGSEEESDDLLSNSGEEEGSGGGADADEELLNL